jgi:hypothetical protein
LAHVERGGDEVVAGRQPAGRVGAAVLAGLRDDDEVGDLAEVDRVVADGVQGAVRARPGPADDQE